MATEDNQSGKGHPTPKRKDVEAKRKQGFSAPRGTKEARKAARLRAREQRMQARVRNFIDSRRTVGEVFVIVAFLVLALGLVNNAKLQSVVVFAWSAVLLLVIVDTTIVGFLLARVLRKEFPNRADRKGAISYGVLRALQLRKFRIPPALVGPGGKPVKVKQK